MNLEEMIHPLYNYCLKLSHSPWVAEELVQETMFKIVRMKKAEPDKIFTFAYLCTVAKNHFIDEKRREKQERPYSDERFGEVIDPINHSSLLEILFSSLPLKQAMLITLKDVFGYRTKEIAEMLRLSNEFVKTSLHRSRKKLRAMTDVDRDQITLPPQTIIYELSRAIQDARPMAIFYYYRLLDSYHFQVRRTGRQNVFHVIDPDGNILEVVS